MFSFLLKRNSLLFLAIFIPSISLAGQYTPVDGSTSEENTDTLNRSLNDLYKTKLDVRPTNLLPLHTTSYMLGNTSYKWSGVFADSITVTNIYGLSSLSLTTLTASTITVSNISITTVSYVAADTGNGHGGTNTAIRRFTNATTIGRDITYADSAANGGTFTVNRAGYYTMSYSDRNGASAASMGISVNSTNNTTSIGNLTPAQGKIVFAQSAAALYSNVTATVYLNAGDIVRAHTDGSPNSTTDNTLFRIIRIF